MLEIKGKMNTAICYTNVIEDEAIEQIRASVDIIDVMRPVYNFKASD